MSGSGDSEIDGNWELVRAEFDGVPAPELVVRNTTVELGHGEYRVRFDGETADAGTFEFAEGSTVRTMFLHGIAGPNSGRTIPCLFKLSGNRLCVCYGLDGVMPATFLASKGDSRYLATYRRSPKQP